MGKTLITTCMLVVLVVVGESASGKSRRKAIFECPFDFGVFANPQDCSRFYICSGSVSYDISCPHSFYFDDSKKMCGYKTKDLQCGPIRLTTQAPTSLDPDSAPGCLLPVCKLPNCFCSEDGTQIPLNVLPKRIPQMIILAFSGALNVLNAEPFGYLLNDTRFNPNGCPIKATFFVPHEHTSYYYVQKLYGQGHEIAMQTITNRQPEEFWPKASIEDWVEEVIGVKEILHTFSNISKNDLLGMRAPFLKPGGNNMMSMIYDYGLEYDSSLVAPPSEIPLWPYTLDHHIPHACLAGNCPTRSFPGIWEFPLNTMDIDDGMGGSCVFMDQCVLPDDAEVISEVLYHNFQRHYFSNRAPLLFNFDVNWVTDGTKLTALDGFIDHILVNFPDAWFVTMKQALEWMRNPVRSTRATSFEAWKCPRTRQFGCNIPRTCAVKIDGDGEDVRYIQLCGKCPERYPWLNNIRGTNVGKKVQELVQKTT